MMRGLKHLSYKEMLRVGVVQPRNKTTPGRPYSSLPVLEVGLQES